MTCLQCPQEGRPKFCSRQCAATYNAALRAGSDFYRRIGALGSAGKHHRGRVEIVRSTEMSLMAQGRYREAARIIYERGYSAGWLAGRRGHRQLPVRGAA